MFALDISQTDVTQEAAAVAISTKKKMYTIVRHKRKINEDGEVYYDSESSASESDYESDSDEYLKLPVGSYHRVPSSQVQQQAAASKKAMQDSSPYSRKQYNHTTLEAQPPKPPNK